MKALVEKEEYAPGTLRRFEVLERHVEDYIASKYNRTDFNVKRIGHQFIDGFDFYLHTAKENDTNTWDLRTPKYLGFSQIIGIGWWEKQASGISLDLEKRSALTCPPL